MIIDHIGIAVSNLDQAIKKYESLLQAKVAFREFSPEMQVELAFFDIDQRSIELLTPTSDLSVLKKFIDARGVGIHHICFRVKDIKAELERYKELGYKLIDQFPRKGSRSTIIAFVHPNSTDGVLIELCQQV